MLREVVAITINWRIHSEECCVKLLLARRVVKWTGFLGASSQDPRLVKRPCK